MSRNAKTGAEGAPMIIASFARMLQPYDGDQMALTRPNPTSKNRDTKFVTRWERSCIDARGFACRVRDIGRQPSLESDKLAR